MEVPHIFGKHRVHCYHNGVSYFTGNKGRAVNGSHAKPFLPKGKENVGASTIYEKNIPNYEQGIDFAALRKQWIAEMNVNDSSFDSPTRSTFDQIVKNKSLCLNTSEQDLLDLLEKISDYLSTKIRSFYFDAKCKSMSNYKKTESSMRGLVVRAAQTAISEYIIRTMFEMSEELAQIKSLIISVKNRKIKNCSEYITKYTDYMTSIGTDAATVVRSFTDAVVSDAEEENPKPKDDNKKSVCAEPVVIGSDNNIKVVPPRDNISDVSDTDNDDNNDTDNDDNNDTDNDDNNDTDNEDKNTESSTGGAVQENTNSSNDNSQISDIKQQPATRSDNGTMSESEVFDNLSILYWRDKDEAVMTQSSIKCLSIDTIRKLHAAMIPMAEALRTAISNMTGAVENMSEEDRNNFLYHVIAKGKNVYYESICDANFCLHMVDTYQPLYQYMLNRIQSGK